MRQERLQIPKQRPKPPEEPIDDFPEIKPNKVSKAAGEFLVRMSDGEA